MFSSLCQRKSLWTYTPPPPPHALPLLPLIGYKIYSLSTIKCGLTVHKFLSAESQGSLPLLSCTPTSILLWFGSWRLLFLIFKYPWFQLGILLLPSATFSVAQCSYITSSHCVFMPDLQAWEKNSIYYTAVYLPNVMSYP